MIAQGQVACTYELVFLAVDIGNIHIVGGGAEIFELLAGENINGNEMDLGVTVFAGLGGTHFNNLAGTTLDNDESVFAKGRALHRIGGRCSRICRIESMPWGR